MDTTVPITQEQADESLATTLAGIVVDPNAETAGGHTATAPAPTCSWNATTMWSTCTGTNNGLTITRQMQFLNAAGTPQQRPDSTTNSMKAKTTVTGTTSFTHTATNGPTITTTVSRNSDETVTGLAKSSTQRVVNGTASGTENSTGTDSRGTITVARTYADTTKDMTFKSPPDTAARFPLSGTITRNIASSVTVGDAAAKSYTSREVHKFEAGGKLTVTTTMNGQTRTCVIQLGSKTKPTCT
jgi:hypothetical protein